MNCRIFNWLKTLRFIQILKSLPAGPVTSRKKYHRKLKEDQDTTHKHSKIAGSVYIYWLAVARTKIEEFTFNAFITREPLVKGERFTRHEMKTVLNSQTHEWSNQQFQISRAPVSNF